MLSRDGMISNAKEIVSKSSEKKILPNLFVEQEDLTLLKTKVATDNLKSKTNKKNTSESLQTSDTKRLGAHVDQGVTNQESTDHQTIVNTSIDTLLAETNGMETIRTHFLEEINIKRKALGNGPLKLNDIINDLAQEQAKDMAKNQKFEHSASSRMVKDGRYNFETYSSNVSYNFTTINDIIQSYINNNKRETGHYDILSVNAYKDLGVGMAKGTDGKWYIVANYGKELPKK